jgi:hypothetical protein
MFEQVKLMRKTDYVLTRPDTVKCELEFSILFNSSCVGNALADPNVDATKSKQSSKHGRQDNEG